MLRVRTRVSLAEAVWGEKEEVATKQLVEKIACELGQLGYKIYDKDGKEVSPSMYPPIVPSRKKPVY